MSVVPWSLIPKINELSLTDVLMRGTPSQGIKNQEIPMADVLSFLTAFGSHTGVRTGLKLSINADSTKFDFTAGEAMQVNRNPDPTKPTITSLSIPESLANLDNFLGDTFTFVFLDILGMLVIRNTPPSTLDDIHNLIFLGQLRHSGGVIVTADDNPIMAHGSSSSHLAELVFAGGVTLAGAKISPNGANLQVDIDPAILEQFGRGRSVNENAPNEYESSAQFPIPASNFFKAFIDGTGELILDNSTNLLDPTQFNDGGLGTLQTVSPSNNYTVIRVFQAAQSEAVVFYYGTETFSSSADALAATEPTFTEHPDTIQISPVAKIAIKGNVTDFSLALTNGDAVIQRTIRRV